MKKDLVKTLTKNQHLFYFILFKQFLNNTENSMKFKLVLAFAAGNLLADIVC